MASSASTSSRWACSWGSAASWRATPPGARRCCARPSLLAQTFDDPSRLGFAGAAARYLGDDTATHDFYGRAVARARATGELVLLPYLLESLAVAEVAAGRYAAATASASEGLRLARETGQESSVCRNLSTLALLAAMQGREDACRSYAAEALEHAVPRGLRLQAASAAWALALLDLASEPAGRGAQPGSRR